MQKKWFADYLDGRFPADILVDFANRNNLSPGELVIIYTKMMPELGADSGGITFMYFSDRELE